MSADLELLFAAFDHGRLSRRQLLAALGIAVIARPVSVFAQGQCGGARAGTPECDTTPAKLPFPSTGWTTVLLDHFSCQVADYQKEAAYYDALMNWKIRSDDGKQAVLDIGDWGGLVLRGGYEAPPPPPAAPPGSAGGRGGGRGGNGPRIPRLASVDGFCWGIHPWDTKKVEAALRERGLDPVADHQGKDFQSFHVKDPDGFDLQISNGSRSNRRRGPASAKPSAPAPFERTPWKTVWLDHISFECTNYKESVGLLHGASRLEAGRGRGQSERVRDWRRRRDHHPPRRPRRRGTDPSAPAPRRAQIGHIAFGIQPFDPDAVKAALDARGLTARVDTGGKGDIQTSPYKSYHTTTPNGFDLQISATTIANRNAGSLLG